ncbi:MAG: hypothetical protein IJE09_06965 [Oscillospiraceae bacterium]|nr:hypothetical protein [Oscillospiraceae bacterium]
MKIHVVNKPGELIPGEKAIRKANLLPEIAPLCPGQSLFIPGERPDSDRSIEVLAFSTKPIPEDIAKNFTYFSPYCYSFDTLGELIAPGFGCNNEGLRAEGCAPLLCLANFGAGGGFSPELAHRLLSKEDTEKKLCDELISTMKAEKYYGLQLCFNYLFPFDRDNYSDFVLRLSQLLHREGFILSLELPPPDLPALSSAFDYKALGQYADRLSLMFCRWAHAYSPPLPLAPLPYIRAALDKLCPIIASEKMLLGISGSGFDWRLPWRQGDSARQISTPLAAQLAMSQRAEIRFDPRAQAPYFDYLDAIQLRRRVYFEDARSIAAKLDLLPEYALAGIALYSWEKSLRPGNAVLERLYTAEKLL